MPTKHGGSIAIRIDGMNLKDRLRDIETNCRDRLAPPNRGSLNSAHIHGTHVPGGGAVHSINTRHEGAP